MIHLFTNHQDGAKNECRLIPDDAFIIWRMSEMDLHVEMGKTKSPFFLMTRLQARIDRINRANILKTYWKKEGRL